MQYFFLRLFTNKNHLPEPAFSVFDCFTQSREVIRLYLNSEAVDGTDDKTRMKNCWQKSHFYVDLEFTKLCILT